jgi:hypothetical protein
MTDTPTTGLTWVDFESQVNDRITDWPELEDVFTPFGEFALIMQAAPKEDATATEVKAWQREIRECADLITRTSEAFAIALKNVIPAATIPDNFDEGLRFYRDLARAWPEDFERKTPAAIVQDLLKKASRPSFFLNNL